MFLQIPETAIDLAKQLGISGVVAILVLDRIWPFFPKKGNGHQVIETRLALMESKLRDLEGDTSPIKGLTSSVDKLVGWLEEHKPRIDRLEKRIDRLEDRGGGRQ
jgi:hypothetical protein